VTVPVPELGAESITEGTLSEYAKKVGDQVRKDEVIAMFETDKVTVDAKSPCSGTITELLVEVDATVNVGDPLVKITEGEVSAEPAKAAEAPAATPAAAAAPAAEKPAEKPAAAPASKPAPAASAPATAQSTGYSRVETREKISRMRGKIAQNLKNAQNTTASLTTFNEIDMTNAVALRKEFGEAFLDKHGVKLGFMSMFSKATAAALMEIPAINGLIDDAAGQIVYRDYVDLSIAVASPKGLVVPVVRNAESMSFWQVEKSIYDLAMKARNGAITVDDMTGGTFTITNGGIFGSVNSTPIINMPQSAILGLHAMMMRPMVVNGEIKPRMMMNIALTYDHRLVDGREAATFLVSIKNKMEEPRRMLLEL